MKNLLNYILLIIISIFYGCKEGTGLLQPKESLGETFGGGSANSDAPVSTDKGYSLIFSTNDAVDASGSADKDGTGSGLVDFDAFCNAQAASHWGNGEDGITGTFKALINTSTRRACYSSNCNQHGRDVESLNWVLAPNREYRRPEYDGNHVTVGTTNENALFDLPLNNPVHKWGTNPVWAGFNHSNQDWQSATNNCDDFTTKTPVSDSATTYASDSGAVDSDFLGYAGGSTACNVGFGLSVICVEEFSADVSPSAPDGEFGILFTTTQSVDGTGATDGDGSGSGVSDFDAVCTSEATGHSLTGTFKALLYAGGTRRGCHSSNCVTNEYAEGIDWPLPPNKEYRRLDKTTVIGTTNAGGVFEFPLTNSVDGNSDPIWGSFSSNTNWTGNSSNCTNYTSDSGSTSVIKSNLTSTQMLNDGSTSDCNQRQAVMCARVYSKPEQTAYRKIFMTSNNYQGGSGFLNADGPVNFDAICAGEAVTKGLNIESYKAFIQGNNTGGTTWRRACYSAYCGDGVGENLGWVLDPNTEYRREDGTTIIGTTNSESLFNDPLTNSFTGTADYFWTGFTESFAIMNIGGGGNNCLNFTSKSAGGASYCGIGNATTGITPYRKSGAKCNCAESLKILCVEQTRSW